MEKKRKVADEKTLSKCPKELEEYINLVNRVSYDIELVDGQKQYKKNINYYLKDVELSQKPKSLESGNIELEDESVKSTRAIFLKATNETIHECFANLPNEFREYLREKAWRESFGYQGTEEYDLILARRILSEYIDFYEIREDLQKFVEYFDHMRKSGFFTGGVGGMYANGKLIGLPAAKASFVQLWGASKHGTIVEVRPHGLSGALDGIIGERVRSCEVCKKIFWAQRKESETDSPTCANKLRVRRHREKAENKESN